MFNKVDPKPNFPEQEEKILKFWQDSKIFDKTLKATSGKEPFVFFEGPPTANAAPGLHHVLARAFKDIVCRYQTMKGKYVRRKAGWDTHGLPVEIQIEKKLGISGKPQIENIVPGDARASIIEFNKLCRESVWQFKEDWERMTERMGYWLDMRDPYITYEPKYIESVWYLLKQFHQKNLLYQGFKVVPYCPRCGTALATHEVAQGYQDVTETSVYIKFKLKDQDAFILSWTTTPWTLPGNVALAVGKDITYVRVKANNEVYILAKDRLSVLENPEILEELKGSDLLGLEYEPLFPGAIPVDKLNDRAFKVYAADFVTTEDGTGVVHTAVMYGVDDFVLGKQVGLPEVHTVDETGKFLDFVPEVAGMFVKDQQTENKILDYLGEKNYLLKTEPYTHSYPFCWRCGTPLLYYARNSWFIRMSELRDQLIANNENIHWEPEHIKEGRFGEWLRDVKDWAISRERYWGTPLPIWKCDKCGEIEVIGSYEELNLPKQNNTFFFARHGEAENNVLNIISYYPEPKPLELTEKGKEDAIKIAAKLKEQGGIDLIYSSDLLRCKHTAEIVGEALGVPVKLDERLREFDMGIFNGKKASELDEALPVEKRWEEAPDGGETYNQVQTRMSEFVDEINSANQNKRILVISHGDPLYVLQKKYTQSPVYPSFGSYISLDVEVPEVHRPFVDDLVLKCKKCGGDAHRTPEVMDVWFDSGSMPYAQEHWPFEKGDPSTKTQGDQPPAGQFPADFISEAVDQTRGWFYTLHAISTALGFGPAYKQVICLGHILDARGQKMSKSKGNIVNPWEMFDSVGADAIRWYFYTVNQPGESKLFDKADVVTVQRRTFTILWNVLNYFVTYANNAGWTYDEATKETAKSSANVLDQWLQALLEKLVGEVGHDLDALDITSASRKIDSFINDFSTWYLRRSRGREDKEFFAVTHKTLYYLARLMAPFAPFFAESVYDVVKLQDGPESVHLTQFPESKGLTDEQKKLLSDMEQVRAVAELGNAIRKNEGLKVRQPLASMNVVKAGKTVDWSEGLKAIILDELNIKSFAESHGVSKEAGDLKVEVDTKLTPELQFEGDVRELERAVQALRKEAGLQVGEQVKLYYQGDAKVIEALDKKRLSLGDIIDEKNDKVTQNTVSLSGGEVWLGLEKV